MDAIDPYVILSEIFSNKTRAVIENVIRLVQENAEGVLSPDEKLEAMINLLSGNENNENNIIEDHIIDDELLDEAAGINADEMENYSGGSVTNTLKRLLDIFPDADPTYLETKAAKLSLNSVELQDFIDQHIEKKDYPTMEDYNKRNSEKSEMAKYIFQFDMKHFFLEFSDPIEHFSNSNRKHALSDPQENEDSDLQTEFALKCLCNQFRYLRQTDIEKIFKKLNKDLVKSYYKLKKVPRAFKTPRAVFSLPDITIKNILLLQEIAFLQHEEEMRNIKKQKEINFKLAKESGLLESCSCCFTEDLIPEDCYLCKNHCIFCKDCLRKAAEVAYTEGKTEFPCLNNCGSDYSLSTLQMILNPKIFANLFHRIQLQEINNAQIPGLELCPLCSNFAMIPDPTDKIFHCDKCKKDSCRECKHEAHVPLRCNEIEYDEDVKIRTYIENKMSDALLRKCYKCDKMYIKNSGCNKITCSCGAKMCYLCRAPVTDYTHFSDAGCRLFTNDEQIHLDNVISGANAAKRELGVDVNPGKLKIDPAKDLPNAL